MSRLDPTTARQLVENLEPALLQRVLDAFADDLRHLTAAIEADAAVGDHDGVRRAAHSLAGAAAAVGAVALERVARSFLAPRLGPYPRSLLGRLRREGEEALRACSGLSAAHCGSA